MQTNQESYGSEARRTGLRQAWLAAAALAAGVAGLGGGFYSFSQARQLAATQQATNAALGEMQKHMMDLSEQISTLDSGRLQPSAELEERTHRARRSGPASTAGRPRPWSGNAEVRQRTAAEDPRFGALEGRLAEQAGKIEGTQRMVEETRRDLEGRLTSTRDELNTSIARTHEEVVALRKRGERDYFEFKLMKSKDFRPVGPVSLSLRKADSKRQRYNMELYVDDFKLQKKDVNLYEPVYFTVQDRPQPLELVVNHISKDRAEGYISMPKYKTSELAADTSGRTRLPLSGVR